MRIILAIGMSVVSLFAWGYDSANAFAVSERYCIVDLSGGAEATSYPVSDRPGPITDHLLCHLSFDDQGNGGLNVLKVEGGEDAIVRTTPANDVSGLGAVTLVTDSEILAGLEPGDGAVCIPRGTHLALPIPKALLDREGHPYTIKMKVKFRI